MSFIHLHCHSEYSLLESPFRLSDMVSAAKTMDMHAVALTDNGAMYGAIEFYLKAKEAGIKPIIGCEVYIAPDMRAKERGFDRLILLCKDYAGYQSLVKLVTLSHLEGFYYKPRLDFAALELYKDGLIAISSGLNGVVGYPLQRHQIDSATERANRLKAIYGDDFYLGIHRIGVSLEETVTEHSLTLSKQLNIGVVAINDVYYAEASHAPLRQIVNCIQTGRRLEDDTRGQFLGRDSYFKSQAAMTELFKDIPEAIENTVKIADLCNLKLQTDQVHLPRFECPDHMTVEEYMAKLVKEGISRRYPGREQDVQDRVDFEMSVITKMGYAPYFLIIYDFLDFCAKQGIPVGPGRGSAAGSIVAYALNITNIDPIEYKLLFERFLNPDRVSMPDVDLDFCIRRRGEVIDYIVKKYGAECVSQIITFGTMAARGVVRDVGRVLNIPLSDVDRIAKLIPSTPGQYTSIPEALEQIPELKKLYDDHEEFKELLDIGAQLEGVARHSSTHAAGVVISRDPLSTVVPLAMNDGQVTTQYAMTELEKVGLLKMDILGLRNLTVMQDACQLIKQHQGIELDLNTLDFKDQKTYDLLCTGESAGIFQLESRGMRQLIKDLQPSVFEDIIALLALYRPGPLGSGMVSEFISNKSGKTQVKYELDILEPILKDTYGMIVYQEQVMQIASSVGGFTLGQADMLRRAMGKKKKSEMDKMADAFMAGAEKLGFDLGKAKRIFDLCYKFAEYGFNKSHSAAYALISFQTAYLKAHYPVEYMAALLSSVLGVSDKTSLYIDVCRQMGIEVLPPSINQSYTDYTVIGNSIRFGLGAVKNVGEGAIDSIVKERQTNGEFKTLSDLCLRVDLRQVNKRVLESLIKCGAMDALGDRSKLLATYERVLDQAQTILKERSNGQTSMFSQIGMGNGVQFVEDTDDYDVLTNEERLRLEKELLGLYISGHPLEAHRQRIEAMPFNLSKCTPEDDNKIVEMIGILSDCKRVVTKSKSEMLLGTLTDFKGELRILMFHSDQFEEHVQLFKDDHVVKVRGRLKISEDEMSIRCDSIMLLDSLVAQRQLHIDAALTDNLALFEEFKKVARSHRGAMPVFFHVGDQTILAHKRFWVTDDALCLGQVEGIFGSTHTWIAT